MDESTNLEKKLSLITREHTATIDDIPIPVMRTLFNELTGKKETLGRAHYDDCIINLNDICDLERNLDALLQKYLTQSVNTKISIRHADGSFQKKSSLSQLAGYCQHNHTSISELYYELNFLIIDPSSRKHESYSVKITMRSYNNNFKSFYLFSGILENERDGPPFGVNIEYVDSIIAQQILAMTDQWWKNLDRIEIPVKNRKRDFEPVEYEQIPFVFDEMLIILSAFLLSAGLFLLTSNNFHTLLYFGVYICSYSIFSFFSRNMRNTWRKTQIAHGYFPFIAINRGGEREVEKFKADNIGNFKKIATSIKNVQIGIITNTIFSVGVFIYGIIVGAI